MVEAFNGNYQELPGRVRKLMRLYAQRKKLLAQQGWPRIHFGKKFFIEQEKASWKKAYDEARSDRIGCLGSADETGGNSTFQLKTICVDGKPIFNLFHAGQLMGHMTLSQRKGWFWGRSKPSTASHFHVNSAKFLKAGFDSIRRMQRAGEWVRSKTLPAPRQRRASTSCCSRCAGIDGGKTWRNIEAV